MLRRNLGEQLCYKIEEEGKRMSGNLRETRSEGKQFEEIGGAIVSVHKYKEETQIRGKAEVGSG